ncbi:hypothetical protein AHAS_Ahas11G0142000 [Arachis hypogaea]
MEFNSSCDQTNFMGYYPPSPIDYPNGGYEYHQEITDSEHSNQWRYASEPQDEQENYMGYFPPPQNDSNLGGKDWIKGMNEKHVKMENSGRNEGIAKAVKPTSSYLIDHNLSYRSPNDAVLVVLES